MIHRLAEVEPEASVHPTAVVWRWSLIRKRVTIGPRVKVGTGCVVGPDVEVREGTKIEDGAKLYGPLVLGRHVFIGPNAVVCNDRHPSAADYDWHAPGPTTCIDDGASVGANAVIMPGVLIGKGAVIGAGAVVTHDVPAAETWCGVPANRGAFAEGIP